MALYNALVKDCEQEIAQIKRDFNVPEKQ
jgi:hypothetical protein